MSAARAEAPHVAALIEESGVLQAAAAAQEQVAVLLQQQLQDLQTVSSPQPGQYVQAKRLLSMGHDLLIFWDSCYVVSMLSGSDAVTPPALEAAHLANALFQGSDLFSRGTRPFMFATLARPVHIFQVGVSDAGGGLDEAFAAAAAAVATGAQQGAAAEEQQPPIDARLLQLLLTLLVLDAHVSAQDTAAGSNTMGSNTEPAAAAAAGGRGLESLDPLVQACGLVWSGLSLPASTLLMLSCTWRDQVRSLQHARQASLPSPAGGSSACSTDSGSVGSRGSSTSSGGTCAAGGQAPEGVAPWGGDLSRLLLETAAACVWRIRQGDVLSGLVSLADGLLDVTLWRLPQLLVALAAHSSSQGSAATASSSRSSNPDTDCFTLDSFIVNAAACGLQLWAQAGLPAALQKLHQEAGTPEELAHTQQVLCDCLHLMLTCCPQLLRQQTLLLDAAGAAAAEAAALEQGKHGTNGSSIASSSGSSKERGSCAMRALVTQLQAVHRVLAMLIRLPASYIPATDAAWRQHSAAVCRALEQLARTLGRAYTTLSSIAGDSSSAGGSGSGSGGRGTTGGLQQQCRGGQPWQDVRQACAVVFGTLSKALHHMLMARDNSSECSALTAAACRSPSHSLEERRALASLSASYLKLCGTFGQAAAGDAQYGALFGVARAVTAITALLSRDRQGEYCLAAVRAAAAPWMVLMGRQLMLAATQLSPILAQASQAALAAGQGAQQAPLGGCLDCHCKSLLSDLVEWVMPVAAVWQTLGQKLPRCWTEAASAQYQGQRQCPDEEQQQGCRGEAQAQVHPRHHLQCPGLPLASSSGEGGREGGSSAAAGCVLLDDLDSCYDGPLTELALKLAPVQQILCEVIESELSSEDAEDCGANDSEPAEASSSNSSGSGGSSGHQAGGSLSAAAAGAAGEGASHDETSAQTLTRVLQSGHLEGLPQLLHAAGSSLCSQLAVPWFCNNPDCRSLSGASELRLVGGHGCVCGGCTVARYCGRACQRAHWKQHKPVCRALAARAAAQAGPARS